MVYPTTRSTERRCCFAASLSAGSDADQAWFWTLDWLSGELEAERQAQSDPGVVYQDAESLKAALHTARSE
jgi:hypothetical protein